jgi:C_GCAxxG_C_C family probable redox protein
MKATELFDREYNCAQAVLKAVIEYNGISIDDATNVAAGFGGGITYSGQQCGAISGALMSLGAIVGTRVSDILQHKAETYKLAEELQRKFKEEFGSIICDVLTGIDMGNAELRKRASTEGHFMDICPKFVNWCATKVMELSG